LPKVVANRYKVEKLLGKGAAGKVYLVRDRLEDKRLLALKLLETPGTRHLELMRHEFSTLTKIRHPNIARVYDFGLDEKSGLWFYTSEYIEGSNIVEMCKGLDFADGSRLFAQVFRALQHIHSRGIIHYDVKPGNIIVDTNRVARLIDFGLATTETPISGSMRGTIGYAAPEVVRGELGDPRSDLYSLGVVFYEAIAGKRPYEDDSILEVLRLQAATEPEPPRKFKIDVPVELERIVLRLLEREPGLRYYTANEVNRALSQAMDISLEEETVETALAYLLGGGFIGREEELDHFRALMDSLREGPGKPSLWFITGETGIGKSRLLREAGYFAQLKGNLLIKCRCSASRRRPYGPFAEVIGNIIQALPKETLDEFEETLGMLAGEERDPDMVKHGRVMHDIALLLMETAALRPLVISIDDLENADEDTLSFLEHLARVLWLGLQEGKHVPLLVLCACNTEVETAKTVIGYMDRSSAQGIAGQVSLSPLTREAAAGLLSAMLGGSELPANVLSTVLDAAGGNPLIIEQTVQQLFETGLLFFEAGKWRTTAAFAGLKPPAKGEEALQRRIKSLVEDERVVVDALACVERPAEFDLLQEASAIPPDACAAAVKHLLSRGLLWADEEGNYAFASGRLGEVVLRIIPREQCRAMHGQIYSYLKKKNTELIERAIHAEKAGVGEDELLPLLWDGAKHAAVTGVISSAVRLFEALKKRLPGRTEGWFEALDWLAKCYWRRARLERVFDCITAASSDELWKYPEYAATVAWFHTTLRLRSGKADEAELFLQEAQDRPGVKNSKPLKGELLIHLGRVAGHKGEPEKARKLLSEARDIFKSLKDKEKINTIDSHLASSDYGRGKYADAVKRANRILRRKSAKDHFERMHVLLAGIDLEKGKPEKALVHYYIALDAYEKRGNLMGVAYTQGNIGNVLKDFGQYDEALDAYTAAKRFFEISGDEVSIGAVMINIGDVHLASGRTREALSSFEQASEVAGKTASSTLKRHCPISLGTVCTVLGRTADALAYFEEALQIARKAGITPLETTVLNLRAEALAFLCGDFEAAERDLSESRELAGPQSPARLGEALALSARHAMITGDIKRARRLIEQAQELKITGQVGWGIELAGAGVLITTGRIPAAQKILARLENEKLSMAAGIETTILKARCSLRIGKAGKAREIAAEALKTAYRTDNIALVFEAALTAALAASTQDNLELAAGHFNEAENAYKLIADVLPEGYDRQQLRESPFFSPLDDVDPFRKGPPGKEKITEFPEEDFTLDQQVLDIHGVYDSHVARREMALLEMIARLAATELDVEKLLDLALAMVLDTIQAERGFIILVDEGAGLKHLSVRNIRDREITSPEYQTSHTMVGEVINSGQSRLVANVNMDESLRDAKSVVDLSLCSVLCVPIKSEGRTMGVVYLDTTSLARSFTEADLHFVEALAERIAPIISNAVEQEKMRTRLSSLQKEVRTRYAYTSIVGQSKPMRELFSLLDSVTDTDLTAYIYGETGTGKELVAKALHYNSSRKEGPFVSINCGAMTESLLEGELFGHVKGAFTGAGSDKTGLIESADGGTLFLDEIASMPLGMQVKLLRVIEEREVRRIGTAMPIPIDIRLVCSTNMPLEKLVEQGAFREDLFYRLNVVRIELPPLRERREDIPLLVKHILNELAGDLDVPEKPLESEALAKMSGYNYPGNVRQLRNILQQAFVMAGNRITTGDIVKVMSSREHQPEPESIISRKLSLENYMKEFILAHQHNHNETQLAKLLGVSRQQIFKKRKEWGIQRPR